MARKSKSFQRIGDVIVKKIVMKKTTKSYGPTPAGWDEVEWQAYQDCQDMRRSIGRPPPGCWIGLFFGAVLLLVVAVLVLWNRFLSE